MRDKNLEAWSFSWVENKFDIMLKIKINLFFSFFFIIKEVGRDYKCSSQIMI